MHYLHYNPVKQGLVKQVKDWPYSSFHRYMENGTYDENWGELRYGDDGNFGEV
jgi:putative transposase